MIKRLKGKDFKIKNLSKEDEKKVKIFKDRRGFINKVVNPKGKGRAVIVQTVEPGFTIKSILKGGRERKIGRGLTEKSAIRRALGSGKKTITFRD